MPSRGSPRPDQDRSPTTPTEGQPRPPRKPVASPADSSAGFGRRPRPARSVRYGPRTIAEPGDHPDEPERGDDDERRPPAEPGANLGTISGVRTAPTAAPELKIPLPSPRSAGGRTAEVARKAHGQLNDSPTPSKTRKTIRTPRVGENASAAAASDHQATAQA